MKRKSLGVSSTSGFLKRRKERGFVPSVLRMVAEPPATQVLAGGLLRTLV